MTGDMQSQINVLDSAYQKLSGVQFRARGVITGREQAWSQFVKAGFTVEDLENVLLWLKRRIREGRRDIGAVRFSTLIQNVDRFEEELGLMEAEKRNRRPEPTPQERVLQQARPVVVEQVKTDTAKPIAHWLEKLREAAK